MVDGGISGLYKLYLIKLDERCKEYLNDYAKAYPHWFKDDRKGSCQKNIGWFKEKWKEENIISELADKPVTHGDFYELFEE